MWEWYEKRDPSRIALVPGLIGEPSPQDLLSQSGNHFDPDGENTTATGIRKSSTPRTLNDLNAMTISAKEAQWGQQEESGVLLSDFPALGSEFFDDDSNASSDSGAENFEDSTEKIDYYTQTKEKSTTKEAIEVSKTTFPVGSDEASEMLTPSVKVSNAYINISLNNQSAELAQRWNLGDFDIAHAQPTSGHRNKTSAQFSPGLHPLNVTATLSTDLFSKQGK
jgi:hypothetical protein